MRYARRKWEKVEGRRTLGRQRGRKWRLREGKVGGGYSSQNRMYLQACPRACYFDNSMGLVRRQRGGGKLVEVVLVRVGGGLQSRGVSGIIMIVSAGRSAA